MNRVRYASTVTVALLIVVACDSRRALADYALVQFPGSISRYSDNGEHILDFQVYNEPYQGVPGYYDTWLGESVEGIAVSPSGFVYAVINNLGSGYIQRFDPRTGLGETVYKPDPNSQHNYSDPLYFSRPGALHFGPHGDLYAIGETFFNSSSGLDPQSRVFRFDSQTSAFMEILTGERSEDSMASGSFGDIAFRTRSDSSGIEELFVATYTGILQRHYQIPATPTPPPPPPPTPDSFETIDTGLERIWAIEFGPDGLLYIVDGKNQSIVRYDVDARAIVDTFIDDYQIDPVRNTITDLFFGPDNEVILLNRGWYDEYMMRFDGVTGDYLGRIEPDLASSELGRDEDWGLYLSQHGVYLPIPEPTTFSLLLLAIGAATIVLRR